MIDGVERVSRNRWRTTRAFFFHVAGVGVLIPEGFAWDGASVGPTRKWNLRATMIHDRMYDPEFRPEWARRYDADRAFFHVLKMDGAPWWYRAAARVATVTLFPIAWHFGWRAAR